MENGFYWVKCDIVKNWQPAECEDGVWWLIGSGDKWREDEITIGDKMNNHKGSKDVAFEKQFLAYAENGTTYRLRITHDAPIENGFEAGAILEWSDDERKTWIGHFHIAPDCLEDIAAMLSEAATNK